MSFLLLSLFQDSVPSSCKAATIDKDPDARQAVQSFYCNIFNPHSKPDAVPGDNFLCDVYVLLCWSAGIISSAFSSVGSLQLQPKLSSCIFFVGLWRTCEYWKFQIGCNRPF